MAFEGLDAGDETRRHGDYIALAHDEANDGVAPGQVVTYDGTAVSEVTSSSSDIFGVLYTYQVFEDGETGQTIDQSKDATVKVSGSVIADFSNWGSTPSVGDVLGNSGEVLVLEESDSGADHYEVLLR
jgi:hypothetical protein